MIRSCFRLQWRRPLTQHRPKLLLRFISSSHFDQINGTSKAELDPVYSVAFEILKNMTERQLTKMLDIYCGSNFVHILGSASYLDITGVSNSEADVTTSQ